ncbi:hypothetical protein [Paracoccus sp. MKU1]|uniref:hypothetical protein n=1 Tax=Paracoccus sp. MKU1 TaxID=1745182 RepID=UPI000719081D|nr:hypothetical protein [Paracoccus sp. MKU1]KRW93161.1 hypothetical protein AQY21_26440 [Paracoccus sp. MKU1]
MRDDLNRSEKRLIAALDRIDQFLDRAALERHAPPPASSAEDVQARLHEAQAENRRLSQELAALHERQATTFSACEARLAEAHRRLVQAGQEAARLAAANEVLAEANRALIEAQDGGGSQDEIRRALEAEIESLRAERAAEVAQIGEIVEALDRMIDNPAPAHAADPPPESVAGETQAEGLPEAAELAGDGATLDGERG